jgi:hypothetical protein
MGAIPGCLAVDTSPASRARTSCAPCLPPASTALQLWAEYTARSCTRRSSRQRATDRDAAAGAREVPGLSAGPASRCCDESLLQRLAGTRTPARFFLGRPPAVHAHLQKRAASSGRYPLCPYLERVSARCCVDWMVQTAKNGATRARLPRLSCLYPVFPRLRTGFGGHFVAHVAYARPH